MNKNPFIYCFKSPLGYYFYDFNTNAIIKVNKELYDILKNNKVDENEDNPAIINLKSEGFLKSSHWKKICHPMSFMLKHLLETSLKSLTLQVTQQCNLKCNYCPYSGSFFNRSHSTRNMNFETAKKAIDFYVEHSCDMDNFQVGFYGGEPLIRFDLIKEIVEYMKTKCEGKPIEFRMTTNATLLNEENIEFLMDNNFMLTISLDGPKKYHDRNRHRIDNSGSFELIMEKIKMLYTKYPEKTSNIDFNCVIDPADDIQCVNEFFIKDDMIKEYTVFFNQVSKIGIKDEDKFTPDEDYMQKYNFEVFKLLYSKAHKVENIEVSKIVESYFNQLKNTFLNRSISSIDESISHPGGPCIPGIHKLFVDVDGNFYACEKVCENSKDMIIGNVEDEFYIEKVDEILNIGKLSEPQCLNCWSAKFCYICANHVDKGEGISKEYKISNCESVRSNTLDDFKDYCLLQEINGLEDDVMYL